MSTAVAPAAVRSGRDVLGAAVAVAAFAVLWAVVEYIASGAGVAIEQVVWSRYATHLLALLLLFGPTRGWALVRTTRPIAHFWRSLLMLVMPMSYVGGSVVLGAADTWALFWIAPAAILLLRPRAHSAVRWLATVAACLGTALILRPSAAAISWAAIPAIIMAASFVIYLWMTDDLHDTIPTNLWHSAFWVFVALSFRMPFVWSWPSPQGWLVLVAVGTLGLVALLAVDVAVRRGGSAAFAPTLCLQPVVAVAGEAFVDDVGRRALLGALVICAATGWTLWKEWSDAGRRTARRPVDASDFGAGVVA